MAMFEPAMSTWPAVAPTTALPAGDSPNTP